ncbi:MAG: hypothetical protein V8Q57_02085 [Blautia sp.]
MTMLAGCGDDSSKDTKNRPPRRQQITRKLRMEMRWKPWIRILSQDAEEDMTNEDGERLLMQRKRMSSWIPLPRQITW